MMWSPQRDFSSRLICCWRVGWNLGGVCKKSDYLFDVLDVDFVACGKSLVVVFEPNHLNHIWHLGGIDGRISNGNITWLDTHQCRGNTGISNGTGWRLHHIGFFQFQAFTFSQTSNCNFFWGKLDFTEAEIFWDSRAENEFKLKHKRIRIGNLNKNLGYGMSANCAHESDLNNDNEKQNDDARNLDGKHDDVE